FRRLIDGGYDGYPTVDFQQVPVSERPQGTRFCDMLLPVAFRESQIGIIDDFQLLQEMIGKTDQGKIGGPGHGSASIQIGPVVAVQPEIDRKSTRLNSSHVKISY